jgi:hypothetical protein
MTRQNQDCYNLIKLHSLQSRYQFQKLCDCNHTINKYYQWCHSVVFNFVSFEFNFESFAVKYSTCESTSIHFELKTRNLTLFLEAILKVINH